MERAQEKWQAGNWWRWRQPVVSYQSEPSGQLGAHGSTVKTENNAEKLRVH
jgi:hypothetical protein